MAAAKEIIEIEDSDQNEICQLMQIDEVLEPTRYYIHVQRRIEKQHCMICQQVKVVKYNVSYANLHGFICNDDCFVVFTQKTGNYVIQCQITKIFIEESVNVNYKFIRRCMMCTRTDFKTSLVWEAMDFCNRVCLYRYQKANFKTCRTCKSKITFEQLGKFATRFGSTTLHFCGDVCLQAKKNRIRTCTYCQIFLRRANPNASENFCDIMCKNNYELLEYPTEQFGKDKGCYVCNSQNLLIVFDYNGWILAFCSQECLTVFSFTQNCQPKKCNWCKKYVLGQYLEYNAAHFNGITGYFCSKQCKNISLLQSKKLLCCIWCKDKKYNFDLIATNYLGVDIHICSLFCLIEFNRNVWNLLEKSKNGLCHLCKRNVGSYNCFDKLFCSAVCLNRFNARQRRRFKGRSTEANSLELTTRNIVMVESSPITSQGNVATQVEAKLKSNSTQTKTRTASKEVQADIPVIIKVPIPIYLERPSYKWHEPFKYPNFFKLTVPCPMPIPLTQMSADQVLLDLAMMKRLDPLEEDMLNLAELVEKSCEGEKEAEKGENNKEAE